MADPPDERFEIAPITLRDGTTLPVRQIQAEDKQLLSEAFERLSPAARYRRFFVQVDRLNTSELRYLTEIDHRDHEALAAIDSKSGAIVGVARYVRGAEPEVAEAAIVVGDEWQGRGIATGLLERLSERARAAGINHFAALVQADNVRAVDLFRHFAPEQQTRRSDSGHVELFLELPEPGEMPGSRLARALRDAARGAITVLIRPLG